MTNYDALQAQAFALRKNIADIVVAGNGGHIGGDMSILETLLVLYSCRMNIRPNHADDPDRDRFILSKGHSVEAYLAVLAAKGFLSMEDILQNYLQPGSPYIGHPNNKLPGIEMNTGSLGHGLSVAVGMALAAKMDGRSYRTYVVMGDGELAEGSVWEGAMAAGHYRLDNLCAVVDRNGLQISGSTEQVMRQEDLRMRFESFGWNVIDVWNGNSVAELDAAFSLAEGCSGKPTLILAHTVKGCGSALMENKAVWHHKVPNAEEYAQIVRDFRRHEEEFQ